MITFFESGDELILHDYSGYGSVGRVDSRLEAPRRGSRGVVDIVDDVPRRLDATIGALRARVAGSPGHDDARTEGDVR